MPNNQPSSNPEHRLTEFVLLCLRSHWDPTALPAARELAGTLDGPALLNRACAEGIAPLLYSRLRGEGVLPPAVEAGLHQAYYASARRNVSLLHQLELVLGQFAAAGVSIMLLKGAALALAVYDSPAARPMGDLDLLVRPEDAERALDLLEGAGYAPVRAETQPGAAIAFENEVMLRRPGPVETAIEVHWGLIDSPYYQHHLPMDWFWRTTIPLTVDRTATQMLGPEAQLLHLCAHMVLHHGNMGQPRLLWLHDVAEVVTHYRERIDWDLLLNQARACDLVLPVQRVLPRVAADWQVPIPAAALNRLQALHPSREEARVFAQLTADSRPVARRFWNDLTAMPTWADRLRFAWANLFPSPAYMRQHYQVPHPLLLPLYYPYRWYLGLRSALSPRAR